MRERKLSALLRRCCPRLFWLIIAVSGIFLAWYAVLPLLMPSEEERIAEAGRGGSTEILDCKGGMIAWRVDDQDSWRVPVKLDQVSPWAVSSIIAAEDQRFWEHCGVDPYALLRAVSQNIRHGRRVSGASTISMQSMRLLEPAERDWTAKISEAFRALQTEAACGKEAIMELYLNLAPYGGNVIGIEAAARHYFGKSAGELTLGEAALLSGIPQSPARFNPRKHLDAALRRREYVLERMRDTGMATPEEVAAALREKIVISGRTANRRAAGFADYVLRLNRKQGGVVQTVIDPAVQAAAETLVRQEYPLLEESGIGGLAVVVVDVRDSRLLAMIGNADPDNPVSGMVNGATSRRQPGSLLKPFIFCTAYEQGLLTPKSVVYDVPHIWNEYRPENIDHEYLGAVSAEKALRLSRNIPAVSVLQQIGVQRFAAKLAGMGLHASGPLGKYSLSLALGTAELPLLDLVNAYAALARGGIYKPLTVFAGEPEAKDTRVFTPQSAWLAVRSLAGNRERTLAWKTGTSWNHRDAWAVCISPRYAVGVWCGNFSGSGNNGLLGARAALPVALKLAQCIMPAEKTEWRRPEGVRTRKVCALSGCVPGSDCRHLVDAYYIPGVSPEAVCRLHRPAAGDDSEDGVRIVWPAEVAAFMERKPSGDKRQSAHSVKLVSPVAEATYFMQDDGKEVLNLAAVSSDTGSVSYFVDGEYAGRGDSGTAVEWVMTAGSHTVVAASGSGSVRMDFSVKMLADTMRED